MSVWPLVTVGRFEDSQRRLAQSERERLELLDLVLRALTRPAEPEAVAAPAARPAVEPKAAQDDDEDVPGPVTVVRPGPAQMPGPRRLDADEIVARAEARRAKRGL